MRNSSKIDEISAAHFVIFSNDKIIKLQNEYDEIWLEMGGFFYELCHDKLSCDESVKKSLLINQNSPKLTEIERNMMKEFHYRFSYRGELKNLFGR